MRVASRVLIASLPLLFACGSPIVGAECKKGFTVCNGRCVNLETDSNDCGACGHDCNGFTCKAGRCTSVRIPDSGPDGGFTPGDGGGAVGEGGTSHKDASLSDAGKGRGGSGTPFLPDGGLMLPDPMAMHGCGVGQTSCSGQCVDTKTDLNHCGDCATACKADQVCALGVCKDICDAPLKLCSGMCVDEESDENHCGSCGNVCASGICNAGSCEDATAGSLVVIGHDYSTAPSTAMKLIASNALPQAPTPIHALRYRAKTSAASSSGIDSAIAALAQWQDVDPVQLPAQLRGVGALVIYPQHDATDKELIQLGQDWGVALAQFLHRGGVVVLFETQTKSNAGTFQILEPSGLFVADSRAMIDKQDLKLDEPGDGVLRQVPTHYSSAAVTVHFINITSEGYGLVEDLAMLPVVFRRVIALP